MKMKPTPQLKRADYQAIKNKIYSDEKISEIVSTLNPDKYPVHSESGVF